MRLPDPIGLKYKVASRTVLSASYQLQGNRPQQEDAVFHDSDHIFVIADGIGGLPHGDVASALTVESAVWAVRLGKQKPSEWKEKRLLVQKMIRFINLRVYNKRKDEGFALGLGSTMSLLFFAEKNFYICHVGDSRIYLFRNQSIVLLTPIHRDSHGYITRAIGIDPNPPEMFFYSDRFRPNDMFILATDGVVDVVSEQEIHDVVSRVENTQESLQDAAKTLCFLAEHHRNTDNMTVCIVKYCV